MADRDAWREQDALGWDFEGAERWQTSLGLKMSPIQRLEWLDKRLEEMRAICGLAKIARTIDSSLDDRRPPEGHSAD